jgi:hypothetical protein
MNQVKPLFVVDTSQERKRVPQLFDELTLTQAQEIVNSRKNDQTAINLDFYNGDHWQNGSGWVGPKAGSSGDPVGDATLSAIEKAFVSRNAIKEVVGRHVAGVLGRTVHWKFTLKRDLPLVTIKDETTGIERREKELPLPDEQALINEAEALLVQWWDKRGIAGILQTMTASVLNSKRGVLRLFVPPDLRDDFGNLPTADLETTLDYIYLQHLGANDDTLTLEFPYATVYTEKKSRRRIGVYIYSEVDELIGGASSQNRDRAEMTYLNSEGLTVLRIVDAKGNVDDSVAMPLGGHLTISEMTRPWLITPQIVSQQKLLNLTMTMKQRNTVLGGFLERIFSNVDWPGQDVPDPTTPTGKRWVPEPLKVGAGVMTNLLGFEMEDEDGVKTRLNPSVSYRDPVDTSTFITTEESAYEAILQEANQLHYAQAADTQISGESRKQAREAFKQDLQMSASLLQEQIRWLLETVLSMASYFAGRPSQFEGLRVYVQCRIDSGPISADEMRVAVEMKDAEVWSQETTQSQTGIEDVDAENARIAQEQVKRSAIDAANMAAAQKLLDEENAKETQAPDKVAEQKKEEDVTT